LVDMVSGKLVEVLEQETAIYEDILELSRKKTDTIVEGKVPELENITKQEQTLVSKVHKLESVRLSLLQELSGQLGMKPEKMALSVLVEQMQGKEAEKLKVLQNKIAGILSELKNVNELNSRLIKNSLEYIDFSINLLAAAGAEGNNYGKTGQVTGHKKRNLFDIKL